MKYFKILAAVALLFAASAVSYSVGKGEFNDVYQDACRMSDLIRCYEEHLYEEDSNIEDLECFEELESIFLWDDALGEPVNLKDYVYSY